MKFPVSSIGFKTGLVKKVKKKCMEFQKMSGTNKCLNFSNSCCKICLKFQCPLQASGQTTKTSMNSRLKTLRKQYGLWKSNVLYRGIPLLSGIAQCLLSAGITLNYFLLLINNAFLIHIRHIKACSQWLLTQTVTQKWNMLLLAKIS